MAIGGSRAYNASFMVMELEESQQRNIHWWDYHPTASEYKNIERNVSSLWELRSFVPISSLWQTLRADAQGRSIRQRTSVMIMFQFASRPSALSLSRLFWKSFLLLVFRTSCSNKLHKPTTHYCEKLFPFVFFFFFFLYNPTRHPLLLVFWERIFNLSLSAFPILFRIL